MKFIPILFSTPMVQSERADRKTKTRRTKGLEIVNQFPDQNRFVRFQEYPDGSLRAIFENGDGEVGNIKCPYGKVGDVLWVRETLYQEGEFGLKYVANNECIDEEIIPEIPFKNGSYRNYAFCQVPNIHMPKWACRTFLKIKSIKVERLQDISEEDAKAEGVGRWIEERMRSKPTHYQIYSDFDNPDDPAFYSSSAYYSFETLWRFINGKDSWNQNPWVWVIEFERIEKPENFI